MSETRSDKARSDKRRPARIGLSRGGLSEGKKRALSTPTTSPSLRGSPSARYIYKRARARPSAISFYPLHSFQGPDGERIEQRAVVMVVRSFVRSFVRSLVRSFPRRVLPTALSGSLSRSLSLSLSVSLARSLSLLFTLEPFSFNMASPAATDAGRLSFRWNIDGVRRANVRSNNAHEL